ncbi:glucosamine-6-phosphate deaminase [Aureococcus anophagefferens]|nr:glucosamine-6-phosphate deaminase [Aureococcus anophagefferens]
MKLVIRDDVHSLAGYAASQVAAAINAAKKAGRPCVLGLPVGNTMLQTYATLATMHKRGEVDFAHVVGFVLDEYCGVDVADARSHHHYIYANFASQVNIKRENLHQHPEVTFACDEDATFELRVKTVKWQGLEASSFLR